MITKEQIVELSEALDPQHEGEQWPDPVEWDGRSLSEQGEDLLVLADAVLDGHSPADYEWDKRLHRIDQARRELLEAMVA